MSTGNQPIHPWHATNTAGQAQQWPAPSNTQNNEVQGLQRNQAGSLGGAQQMPGPVQGTHRGGTQHYQQILVPHYQNIPPPPPRTVFDLTPKLQEPSANHQSNF